MVGEGEKVLLRVTLCVPDTQYEGETLSVGLVVNVGERVPEGVKVGEGV